MGFLYKEYTPRLPLKTELSQTAAAWLHSSKSASDKNTITNRQHLLCRPPASLPVRLRPARKLIHRPSLAGVRPGARLAGGCRDLVPAGQYHCSHLPGQCQQPTVSGPERQDVTWHRKRQHVRGRESKHFTEERHTGPGEARPAAVGTGAWQANLSWCNSAANLTSDHC